MEALLNFIVEFGWVAVLIVIFAESGLMVGFFLPGDSLLFVAGTLVQREIFHINIIVFIVCLIMAAILGNSTGYLLGKKFGRKLFQKPNSRFFRQEYLERAEKFYEKNGSKTVVLAMFVPIVRAFSPVVAGIAHMRYQTFLVYNILGAVVWVCSFTLLGYFAGAIIKQLGINIEMAAVIIIFLSLLPGIIHLAQQPENHQRVKRQIKRFSSRK